MYNVLRYLYSINIHHTIFEIDYIELNMNHNFLYWINYYELSPYLEESSIESRCS
jgi:hypothetical protein